MRIQQTLAESPVPFGADVRRKSALVQNLYPVDSVRQICIVFGVSSWSTATRTNMFYVIDICLPMAGDGVYDVLRRKTELSPNA